MTTSLMWGRTVGVYIGWGREGEGEREQYRRRLHGTRYLSCVMYVDMYVHTEA